MIGNIYIKNFYVFFGYYMVGFVNFCLVNDVWVFLNLGLLLVCLVEVILFSIINGLLGVSF